MKRKNNAIFAISTLAIVVLAFFIFTNKTKQPQQQNATEESMITAQEAEAAISFITIDDKDNAFLQSILKSDEVIKALESKEDETLSAENATKLAQEHLSADIEIKDISVLNKNVYVDYFSGDYRIIFQVEPDGLTHKYVGVHDENKNAKELYENIDNKSYKKVIFNTVTE